MFRRQPLHQLGWRQNLKTSRRALAEDCGSHSDQEIHPKHKPQPSLDTRSLSISQHYWSPVYSLLILQHYWSPVHPLLILQHYWSPVYSLLILQHYWSPIVRVLLYNICHTAVSLVLCTVDKGLHGKNVLQSVAIDWLALLHIRMLIKIHSSYSTNTLCRYQVHFNSEIQWNLSKMVTV